MMQDLSRGELPVAYPSQLAEGTVLFVPAGDKGGNAGDMTLQMQRELTKELGVSLHQDVFGPSQ